MFFLTQAAALNSVKVLPRKLLERVLIVVRLLIEASADRVKAETDISSPQHFSLAREAAVESGPTQPVLGGAFSIATTTSPAKQQHPERGLQIPQ